MQATATVSWHLPRTFFYYLPQLKCLVFVFRRDQIPSLSDVFVTSKIKIAGGSEGGGFQGGGSGGGGIHEGGS